jgi:hypothetical protein
LELEQIAVPCTTAAFDIEKSMFDALNLPSFAVPQRKDWPAGSELRTKFGQRVLWWPKDCGGFHLVEDDLESYRQLGDGSVDKILSLMQEEGNPLGACDDLLSLAEEAMNVNVCGRSSSQKEMCTFLETYRSLPDWVDKDQLKRGQEVFMAYCPAAGLSLYYRSLVAGFSIPKIAAVVRSTAYLTPPSRPDQVLQRLLDTGELTLSCVSLGIDALLPGGIGWRTALCVRVLHAKVRSALLRRNGEKRWDTDEFGIPINQEDLAATLLAFSVNVIYGIEFVSGSRMSDGEKADYLALWRYIGWLLGVETSSCKRTTAQPSLIELPPLDPCAPPPAFVRNPMLKANSILQSVIFHLLHPDEKSIEVAHHLLKITDKKPPSHTLSRIPESFYVDDLFYFRSLQCRRFIGNPLADALELPLHPIWWRRWKVQLRSTLTLIAIRIYTLAGMWNPFCRNWMIRYHEGFMVQFHENWKKTHKSKMHKALQSGTNGSLCPVIEESENSVSICPFPMVAKPQGC